MELCGEGLEFFGVDREVMRGEKILDILSSLEGVEEDMGVVILLVNTGTKGAKALEEKVRVPLLVVPLGGEDQEGRLKALEEWSSVLGESGVLAWGEAGVKNAALSAVSILALNDRYLEVRWKEFREEQTRKVLNMEFPD